jgi:hypothetical protein
MRGCDFAGARGVVGGAEAEGKGFLHAFRRMSAFSPIATVLLRWKLFTLLVVM